MGNSFREALDAAAKATAEIGSNNKAIYGGAFSRRTEFEQDKSSSGAQVVSASGAVQNVGGEKAEDEGNKVADMPNLTSCVCVFFFLYFCHESLTP